MGFSIVKNCAMDLYVKARANKPSARSSNKVINKRIAEYFDNGCVKVSTGEKS